MTYDLTIECSSGTYNTVKEHMIFDICSVFLSFLNANIVNRFSIFISKAYLYKF